MSFTYCILYEYEYLEQNDKSPATGIDFVSESRIQKHRSSFVIRPEKSDGWEAD
jgi:hypothetical protein